MYSSDSATRAAQRIRAFRDGPSSGKGAKCNGRCKKTALGMTDAPKPRPRPKKDILVQDCRDLLEAWAVYRNSGEAFLLADVVEKVRSHLEQHDAYVEWIRNSQL